MKRIIGVFVLLALISSVIFWLASLDIESLSPRERKTSKTSGEKRVPDPQPSLLLGGGGDLLKNMSKRYQDISMKSVPSLVHIRAIQGPGEDSLIINGGQVADYYASIGLEEEREGTGFFINEQGAILAPLHVILSAVAIQVRTWDGKIYQAELLATDVGTDLAILKIPLSGTRAIKWGESSSLRLGEHLLLIGTDRQMNGRLSPAVLSSSNRSPVVLDESYFGDYFFVGTASATVRSGWIALNLDGEVVGMLGQSAASLYLSQGEAVVLASSQIRPLSGILIEGRTVERSYAGLHVQSLSQDLIEAGNLPLTQGALVSDVLPGGPAEQAGFLPGDVITKIGPDPVSQHVQLRSLIASLKADQPVVVGVFRNRQPLNLTLTPVVHPMQVIAGRNENFLTRKPEVQEVVSPLDGLEVEDLTAAQRTETSAAVAVRRVDYQQVLPSAPLEVGAHLLEIDGEKVTNRSAFEAIRQKKSGLSRVTLRIETLGKKSYLTLNSL